MAHNNYDQIVNDSTITNDSINKPIDDKLINGINIINNGQQKNIKNNRLNNQSITVDVHKGTPIRLQVKVPVPIDDHPNVSIHLINTILKFLILFSISIISWENCLDQKEIH